MEGGYGARVYDQVYRWKDYPAEVTRLKTLLAEGGHATGSLIDVACGTGKHLALLQDAYTVEGLELDPEMAILARKRGLKVTEGDMETFDLDRRFEIVTCLFSSIGYMQTLERLQRAIARMAAHLLPGGILVVEPWFSPEQWYDGYVSADFVDDEGLKIARMSVSRTDGAIAVMDLHHMVATPKGVETFVVQHRMGLFADFEYRDAFAAAGLLAERDEQGLMGRGLYLGIKP